MGQEVAFQRAGEEVGQPRALVAEGELHRPSPVEGVEVVARLPFLVEEVAEEGHRRVVVGVEEVVEGLQTFPGEGEVVVEEAGHHRGRAGVEGQEDLRQLLLDQPVFSRPRWLHYLEATEKK